MKWNEYVALFGKSESQINEMNRSATGFFRLIQDALIRSAQITKSTSNLSIR